MKSVDRIVYTLCVHAIKGKKKDTNNQQGDSKSILIVYPNHNYE